MRALVRRGHGAGGLGRDGDVAREQRSGAGSWGAGWDGKAAGSAGIHPSAVDGDGDKKEKGLAARRQQRGSSSARGAAVSPPGPAVTSVSAPLKI